MLNYVDASQFANGAEQYLESAVRFNEMTGIRTPSGNAVLMSEEEYDALMETVFVLSSEESRLALKSAAAESIEEAIAEEDVSWD